MRQTLPLFLMTLLAAAPAVAFQTPQATTTPTTPLRIGGQMKSPERIHYVAPAYPDAAIAARVSGTVIVEATVGPDGSVTEAHVLRSIALLDKAALDAVKQWRYTPTTLNGKPVPVIMTVTVNFTPPAADGAAPPPPPAPPSVRNVPAPPTPPAAPQAPTPPPAVDPRVDQSDVNIKLTVKITDKTPDGEQFKTVSLIVANRRSGRVRATGTTATPSVGANASRGSELNVDASATLFRSGVISTSMTISYTPEWTGAATNFTGVSESVELYLKDGVPTIVTQSADPTKGSRSVTVEVTAQVLK